MNPEIIKPVRENIEVPDKPWILEDSTIVGPIGMLVFWLTICVLLSSALILIFTNLYDAWGMIVLILIAVLLLIPIGIYLESRIKINKNPRGRWVIIGQLKD